MTQQAIQSKTQPAPGFGALVLSLFREQYLAYLAIVFALAMGGITYWLLSSEDFLSGRTETATLLMAVDILAVLVLLVFVGRQISRLIAERKRRMAGYQLHVRLVTLFSVVTIFPAVIVVSFSVFVLDFSLRGWFSERISTAISESVKVADSYLVEHTRTMSGQILAMANDINREASKLSGNRLQFDAFLTNQAGVRNLAEAVVMDSTGRVIATSQFAYAISFTTLGDDFLDRARNGEVSVSGIDATNRIRAAVKLNQFVDTYLFVGRFVDPRVLSAVDRTQLAADQYQSLDIRQLNLKVSFALLFGMVALLLLLGAVWVGINFANAVVGPLVSVIQVAEKVRSGDLASRVSVSSGQDEITRLGLSFNGMLDQLNHNREELVEANRQLDKRREFTEAVLAGVSSGVIGLDERGCITLPNTAARSMLGLDPMRSIGKPLDEVVPEFAGLLANRDKPGRRFREMNIEISRDGSQLTLLSRIAAEKVAGRVVGFVVTFDDVSDLLDAQRKAAWADVARRIAHEIKNPLTPIQLSAERLGKKYLPDDPEQQQSFRHYIETIIRQVSDIGRMVNEFSAFARMPAPQMKPCDLHQITAGQLALFSTANPSIRFSLDPEVSAAAFTITADEGMIRQAVTNLLQNAVDVLTENSVDDPSITITLNAGKSRVELEILDNGPGLPEDAGGSLLEPYVTTREAGSGLGLAIVRKIMEDHAGRIQLENLPAQGDTGPAGARALLIFALTDAP